MTGPRHELPLGPELTFLQNLWELNHALERLSLQMQRHIGISAPQRFIVRCVGKYPGMTAGQLASLLHLDPGSVSSALRRLERMGLIERRRDPRDRRRVTLGLTTRGRSFDRPREGTVEAAVVGLLNACPEGKIETARSVIRRLILSLSAEGKRSLPRSINRAARGARK